MKNDFPLVLEVDKPIHQSQKDADAVRQKILETLGLVVLRIKTETIEKNLSMAVELIHNSLQIIKQSTSSPHLGDGQGGGS